MLTFKEAFQEVYDPVMLANGFALKGKIYHRLVNGKIVQRLSYISFGHGRYTIQFDISALCEGYEYKQFMDGERLSELLGLEYEWRYENDEYLQQLPETMSLSQEHIFPYFNGCVDYYSYLETMDRMYKIKFRSKTEGIPLLSPIAYNLNLVLGDYEMAQKSREALINQNLNARRKKWGTDIHPVSATQKKFEKMRDSYYRMKEAMNNNDREYIAAYIKSNEERALHSYIENFWGKKAYQKFLETKQWPLPE